MARQRESVVAFVLAAAVVVAPVECQAQDITNEANWEIDAHVGIVGPRIRRRDIQTASFR